MKEFLLNTCYWLYLVAVLIIGVILLIHCKYICTVKKSILGTGKWGSFDEHGPITIRNECSLEKKEQY